MKCNKCGAEVKAGKFCEECGAPLEPVEEQTEKKGLFKKNKKEKTKAEAKEEAPVKPIPAEAAAEKAAEAPSEAPDPAEEADLTQPQDPAEVREAMLNLQKYEEGTITHPDEKPQKKGKFYCPKNPMLWAFCWLTAFGLVLVALIFLFFSIDIGGTQVVFGITFGVFAAVVFAFSFIYYFPAALNLDKMLKGKGVKLEYSLKSYEIVDLAEKAKKRNRGFYAAIAIFGLAFGIYYTYHMVNSINPTNLLKISLIFSYSVFVIFAALFFIMPIFNYNRMMENGRRVIIGEKAVYFGGNYYHWRCINPEATFGNMNSKKHELEITFTQEFRGGKSQRRKVQVYAPDTALRGINKLLSEYEVNNKKYREKQEQMSILNGKPVK